MASGSRRLADPFTDATWSACLRWWDQGVYRAAFFCELVLAEARRFGPHCTVLDIGCGHGLDGEGAFQESVARTAGRYIGIEPDLSVAVNPCFSEVHRCLFEEAPLAPGSVDVAVALFVLEHLRSPQRFWRRLYDVLVDGGVFWGLTIDVRHWFGLASFLAEWLAVKQCYLDWVRRGTATAPLARYPAFYRSNTPAAVARYAARFRSVRIAHLHQPGQFDAYLPAWLHGVAHWADRLAAAVGIPGPMLLMRAEK